MGETRLQEELFGSVDNVQRKRSFIPKYFIVCPLPVRSTNVEVKEYTRKYNQFKLRIVGANGVPGGKIARDMLMLFATEAVYAKGVNKAGPLTLHFDSINKFVKSIGLERSNYNNKVLEVMDKFSKCSIYFEMDQKRSFVKNQLELTGLDEDVVKEIPSKGFFRLRSLVNVPFFSRCSRIDVMDTEHKRGSCFAIDIELSNDFTRMAQEYGVPIDFTAYCGMQSTLEKDLYVWLVYKNRQAIGKDGIFVSRKNLLEQFGQEDEKNNRVMYYRILETVERIKKLYYGGLNYRVIKTGQTGTGLVLFNSELIIKENDTRYVPLLSI